jgi:delta-lactam-biosynthetic de-N-acetylase
LIADYVYTRGSKGELMKKNKYLVLLLMAGLMTGCQNKDAQDTLAQANNAQVEQEEQATNEADNTQTTEEANSEEASAEQTTPQDATAANTATQNTETTAAETTGAQVTQDVAAEPAQPETTTVEQISLDGLSTESMGWGQGGNVDENNVPVGCNMYQEKYGYLGADFVRTDSDAIYLTFDEGYEYPEANSATGNTAKILDTLKEKGVKGVFFVTLPYAKSNPDLIKRMIDEGHIIGNHSVNHPSKGLPSLGSVEAQQSELTGVDDYMLENYNYKMNLFRYPTGAFSEQSLAIVHNLGYKSVFWSFAYKDWLTDAQPDRTEALNTMKEKLHPGAIYLLHAVSTTNTEVLGDFIDAAKAAGYEIKSYE